MEKNHIFNKLPLYFLYCFIGCIGTIYFQVIECNAIVASSLVGIIIAFFTITIGDENHYSWAAFCGSFAGMLAINNLSYYYLTYTFLINATILSVLCGLLYALVEYIAYKFPRILFDGYGGKLGTTAFISVLIFYLANWFLFKDPTEIFPHADLFFGLQWYHVFIPVSAICGSLISMEIKNTVSSLNDNYKVLTVATTGIMGGILLNNFFAQIPFIRIDFGHEMAAAWYTGAFVGMSSYFVLMLKRDYFIAGTISGILFILSRNLFVGVGGKLGFLSFLAVLIMRISLSALKIIKDGKKVPDKVLKTLQSGESVDNKLVDDAYAQKLVESLMQAQADGVELQTDTEELGNYVIGEKMETADYQQELGNQIINEDSIPPNLREFIDMLHFVNIQHWVFLHRETGVYTTLAYQGLTYNTISKMQFRRKGNLVQTLEREKRILVFTSDGISQKIFTSRIDPQELMLTTLISIVPIFEGETLQGIFFLLDQDQVIETAKNNYRNIKQYYLQEIFK
ncbi:MAG: hypothetical protein MJB14_15415 [Spirochaetes bacterium]|nr:hypothetical protein [Spirochaetota bacterium]